MKGQNFSSQVLSRHTFRILRKKGSYFFDHRGTLSVSYTLQNLFSTFGVVQSDFFNRIFKTVAQNSVCIAI